ncbi:MAG: phenylacetate--CoA ligase family protein [Polyangiaceae bacterium]|nr:phenylacetate--CoA ligase family protein [Polyangiaceae bacterium]
MYGVLFRNYLYPFYETRLRGRETLTRLGELRRSQWWAEEDLREQGFRRMLDALQFAEQRVPYYRRVFAEHGVRARDVKAPEDLLRFPVLTKADIRAAGAELVAEGYRGELIASGTGGSTGQPVRFSFDHRTYEIRIAGAMRADGWAGAQLGERELHVWGTAITQEPRWKRVKRAVHEAALRKKVMSCFELSEARLAEVAREIARYRPRLIVGYVTPLYHVARYVLQTAHRLPAPAGVVATAERLFQHQREVIERAFEAPVFDRYGCREVMLIGAECERHEGKHINAEGVFVELVRGGRLAEPGEPGEVIVTDLACRSMPLVRYRNEDIAIAAKSACSCGRGLPMLASVEGRTLDMIVGPDGQLVAGELFPHMLKDYPTVLRFQVHQDRQRAITVKLVPGDGFLPETPRLIEHELRRFFGARAEICVKVVDDIPLTAGGKHRVTVSEVPVELGRGAPT